MTKREFSIDNEHFYNQKTPLLWLLSHMKRYWYLPLAVLLASVINNYAYSNIQVYLGKGFDVISQTGWVIKSLLFVCIAIGLSAVIQGLTGLLRNFSIEFLAQKIERNSRAELYASLLGKSQSFHSRHKIGDIMDRATTDVRAINAMFSPGLMLIIDSSLALVVPVVMIGLINPNLLLVPGIFTVLLVITVWDYSRRLKPVSIQQMDQLGKLNAQLTEAVNGIEVVKANVRERYEWQKFTQNASQFRDFFIKQGIIQAKYWPMLVFAVTWGLAFLHGLFLWQHKQISIGQVIAFMGLYNTFRFVTFISLFSFHLVQIGMASSGRILRVINEKTELDENTQGKSALLTGTVEFHHISFCYNGTPVLKDISFTAQPGQTVAIVGQTGSGKTTLTRLVNRIFDVTTGQVLVDGIDVREWSLESLRSQISFIEQDIFLYSIPIKDNIAFGKENATISEIKKAAREAQADDFIADFADGYDTIVGERGITLSGGQKQRVAIARAFLTNPKILILDDSTSAIDSDTEDKIQKAMKRISRQRTTFIITHRLSQIRWADKILVLKRGELIAQGKHDELLRSCTDYAHLFARL